MNFSELLGPIECSTSAPLPIALLWGPASFLVDSVEFFLKTGRSWTVVNISSDLGVDYLVRQVQALKPKVVVLCQEKDASDFALLMQLAQIQTCTKVIAVSMESNLVQVYSRNTFILRDVAELLNVVDTK